MNNRRGLGLSSVESVNYPDQSWKDKLGRVGFFLCALILVGLFFRYITGASHEIDSHAAPSNGSDVRWDTTAP